MENLSVSMANFIKMSNALTQREDYEGAKEQLLRACQCALLLAKQSSGLAKEKHIATFNTLKATVATLDAKIKDAANRRAAEQSSRSRNSDSATVSNANQNTYKPQDAVKPSAPAPSAPAPRPGQAHPIPDSPRAPASGTVRSSHGTPSSGGPDDISPRKP